MLFVSFCPTGEGVRAADQHTHKDRGVPNSDFKVRAHNQLVMDSFYLKGKPNMPSHDAFPLTSACGRLAGCRSVQVAFGKINGSNGCKFAETNKP